MLRQSGGNETYHNRRNLAPAKRKRGRRVYHVYVLHVPGLHSTGELLLCGKPLLPGYPLGYGLQPPRMAISIHSKFKRAIKLPWELQPCRQDQAVRCRSPGTSGQQAFFSHGCDRQFHVVPELGVECGTALI